MGVGRVLQREARVDRHLDLDRDAFADVDAVVVEPGLGFVNPVRDGLGASAGGRLGTVSKNTNGTADYGPMQINTVWATRLETQFGVTRQMITDDFCWSVRAGAYILRYEINQAGGSFWDGIGHYHSRTPQYKYQYIERVYRNSLKF